MGVGARLEWEWAPRPLAPPGIQGACQDMKTVDHSWGIRPLGRKLGLGEERVMGTVYLPLQPTQLISLHPSPPHLDSHRPLSFPHPGCDPPACPSPILALTSGPSPSGDESESSMTAGPRTIPSLLCPQDHPLHVQVQRKNTVKVVQIIIGSVTGPREQIRIFKMASDQNWFVQYLKSTEKMGLWVILDI